MKSKPENFERFDSDQSTFRITKKTDKEMLVTFSNVSLSSHHLNKSKEQKFIDALVLKIEGLNRFERIEKLESIDNLTNSKIMTCFGGENMDTKEFEEYHVECDRAEIMTSSRSYRMSKTKHSDPQNRIKELEKESENQSVDTTPASAPR